MIELIKPHRELLFFFAQTSGHRRCVLGLDFEQYDPTDGSVPVCVIGEEQAKVLVAAEGHEFKQAYRSSRPGRSIIVTFVCPGSRGWFKMRWELSDERVFVA